MSSAVATIEDRSRQRFRRAECVRAIRQPQISAWWGCLDARTDRPLVSSHVVYVAVSPGRVDARPQLHPTLRHRDGSGV